MNRFIYEQKTLSQFSSIEPIGFEELVRNPAYMGNEPNTDTHWGGSVIRMVIEPPVMTSSGKLQLDILGPFWDRVYRCYFEDVVVVRVDGINLISFPELRTVELSAGENGRKVAVFTTIYQEQRLTIEYLKAHVDRCMLLAPLERLGNESLHTD